MHETRTLAITELIISRRFARIDRGGAEEPECFCDDSAPPRGRRFDLASKRCALDEFSHGSCRVRADVVFSTEQRRSRE